MTRRIIFVLIVIIGLALFIAADKASAELKSYELSNHTLNRYKVAWDGTGTHREDKFKAKADFSFPGIEAIVLKFKDYLQPAHKESALSFLYTAKFDTNSVQNPNLSFNLHQILLC